MNTPRPPIPPLQSPALPIQPAAVIEAPPAPPSAPGLDILSKVFGLTVLVTAPSYVVGFVYTSVYYKILGAPWYVGSISTNCFLEAGVFAAFAMAIGMLWALADKPSRRARKFMWVGQTTFAVVSPIVAASAASLTGENSHLIQLCAWTPPLGSALFLGRLAAIQCEEIWAAGFKPDRKVAAEILYSWAVVLFTFAFLATFYGDADKNPLATGLPKVLSKDKPAQEDGLTRFVHSEGDLALLIHLPAKGKVLTFSLTKLDSHDQISMP